MFLLFLAFLLLPLLTTARRPVHNFEGQCETCHISPPGEEMIFSKDIDFLCNDCHDELGFSHPSGLKPSFSLPEGFPLDWAGRMTCATCHSIHGEEKYLLRGKSGRAFCYACHGENFETHLSQSQPTHSASKSSRAGFQVVSDEGSVDKLSLECMGCHDETIVRGSGIWTDRTGGSHPIGVDYMEAYIKRVKHFRHPSAINSAVRLFDGKVGCGSCHNIYSKEKFYVTVRSDRKSSLCTSCHIK
ncbi:MAG: hypothetical protein HZA16_02705 [Nitrospirae bacterium]|nr:hypothetical protein [Nitrospirota bacterium]